MAANVVNGPYDTLGMPPDSTGKLMGLIRNVVIDYTGSGNPAFLFSVDDEIIGLSSGFDAFITAVGGDHTGGQISCIARVTSPVTLPTVGENILVGGSVYGTVADLESVYTPGNVIASGDNPAYTAKVDNVGNLYTRFAEGEPQTSPFGMLRTAQPTTLATYTFKYGVDDEVWGTMASGTGSGVIELLDRSSVAVECDIGATDFAQLTTHSYHLYQPLYGSQVGMTIVLGDSGETNNKRRWGMFDDNDGVFFELDGTSLYTVVRSSVTGTPVETRTIQTDWNRDRVDGTLGINNLSKYTINIQNKNIYWIDYQWLGSGRVRFGIYLPTGDRTVLHEQRFAGMLNVPYMARASLPIRVESINSGTTASPKRINFTCAYVSTEGILPTPRNAQSIKWTEEVHGVSFDGTEKAMISFRPKATLNSQVNRKVSVPEKISVYINTNPAILRLRRSPQIDSPSWANVNNPNSACQFDTAGTLSATGDQGRLIVSYFLEPGSHDIVLPENFGLLNENMRLLADGSQTDVFTYTIEEVNSGMAGTISLAATWIDIGGA